MRSLRQRRFLHLLTVVVSLVLLVGSAYAMAPRSLNISGRVLLRSTPVNDYFDFNMSGISCPEEEEPEDDYTEDEYPYEDEYDYSYDDGDEYDYPYDDEYAPAEQPQDDPYSHDDGDEYDYPYDDEYAPTEQPQDDPAYDGSEPTAHLGVNCL